MHGVTSPMRITRVRSTRYIRFVSRGPFKKIVAFDPVRIREMPIAYFLVYPRVYTWIHIIHILDNRFSISCILYGIGISSCLDKVTRKARRASNGKRHTCL